MADAPNMVDPDSAAICPRDSSTKWRTMFAISTTVNGIVLAQLLLLWLIKLICRWRTPRLPCPKTRVTKTSPLARHRTHLASWAIDSLVSLVLFAGAFYLLINGAVANPFVLESPAVCHTVSVGTVLSAISVGRLCVAVIMGLSRVRSIATTKVITQYMRLVLEQLFLLLATVLLLSSEQALLTKALLLVMCIDQSVHSLGVLIQLCPGTNSRDDDLLVKLKVIQSFLSIAFRGAVPLVCLIVSLTLYERDMMKMDVRCVVVVVACGVIYGVYNPWVIVSTIHDMWRLCSNHNGSSEKNPDTFFTRNAPTRLNNCISLEFGTGKHNNRDLHIVNEIHPQNDFDKYLPRSMSRCYCKGQKNNPKELCLVCRRSHPGITADNFVNPTMDTHSSMPPNNVSNLQKENKQSHGTGNKFTKQNLSVTLQTIPEESASMVDIPL